MISIIFVAINSQLMNYEKYLSRGSYYESVGAITLAIKMYEICLYHGKLPQEAYKRLFSHYLLKGDKDNAMRILRRYTAIYER